MDGCVVSGWRGRRDFGPTLHHFAPLCPSDPSPLQCLDAKHSTIHTMFHVSHQIAARSAASTPTVSPRVPSPPRAASSSSSTTASASPPASQLRRSLRATVNGVSVASAGGRRRAQFVAEVSRTEQFVVSRHFSDFLALWKTVRCAQWPASAMSPANSPIWRHSRRRFARPRRRAVGRSALTRARREGR